MTHGQGILAIVLCMALCAGPPAPGQTARGDEPEEPMSPPSSCEDESAQSDEDPATVAARRRQRVAARKKQRAVTIEKIIANAMGYIAQRRTYDAYRSWKSLRCLSDPIARARVKELRNELIKAIRRDLEDAKEYEAREEMDNVMRLRRQISRMEGFAEAEDALAPLLVDKDERDAIRLMETIDGMLEAPQLHPKPDAATAEPAAAEAIYCDRLTCDGRHTGPEADRLLGLPALPDEEPPTRLDLAAQVPLRHQRLIISRLLVLTGHYEHPVISKEAQAFLAELQGDERLAKAFSDDEDDDEAPAESDDSAAEPKEIRLARMYRNGGLFTKAIELYRRVIAEQPDSPYADQAARELAETEELRRQAEEEAETAKVDTAP